MTHTPGPWVWHDRSDNEAWSVEDEGLIKSGDVEVCNFGNNETYYNTAGTRPKDADIALICAAPDLLDALIAAESLFHHTFAMDGTIHKQMRAAIAKATGETA